MISIGSSGNNTQQTIDEDEFMPLAVPLSVASVSGGIHNINAESSTWNDNVTGGAIGRHSYIFTGPKEELDIDAESLDLTLIAGSNVDTDGDGFEKNVTGTSWDSYFYSQESFDPNERDFAVSWLVESTTGTIREMVGLDNLPTANTSYSSIEYAVYQVNNLFYYVVYEKGSSKKTGSGNIALNVGDRIGIKVIDGNVTYFIQSGSQTRDVYTSQTKATQPLYLKAALNRGTDVSGHARVRDCNYHIATSTQIKTLSISGLATESISDDDMQRLSKLGIIPAVDTRYSNINFTRPPSVRFPAGSSLTYNHTYSVNDAQDIQTITV